jgi:hypothetical protein
VAVEEMSLNFKIETNFYRTLQSVHLAAINPGGNPQQTGGVELGIDPAVYQ